MQNRPIQSCLLTILIQREVVLCVAEFLWSACNEDVIIAKEILEAGDLLRHNTVNLRNWNIKYKSRVYWLYHFTTNIRGCGLKYPKLIPQYQT